MKRSGESTSSMRVERASGQLAGPRVTMRLSTTDPAVFRIIATGSPITAKMWALTYSITSPGKDSRRMRMLVLRSSPAIERTISFSAGHCVRTNTRYEL